MVRTVSAAGLVLVLGSCSGGSESDSNSGDGRLSAMYDEHGHLDCRRLYSEVPVSTLLDAGLTTNLSSSQSSEANDAGRSYCPSRYVGPGWPGNTAVPMQLGTSPADIRYDWVQEPEEYRGWGIGRLAMADGTVEPAAMTTVEGRGTFLVFTFDEYSTDAAPDEFFANPLGAGIEDALRHVVDGLEDHSHDLVPDGTTTVFSGSDSFDCSLFYERMTAMDMLDADLDVSDERYAPHRILERENGTESCDLVPLNGVNGQPDVLGVGIDEAPVEITTGPRDDHPGTPLEGDDALTGWEEYWNFAGADEPVNTTNVGKEAYTARFCRSTRDCISVSNFLGIRGEEHSFGRPASPTVRDIKQEILPLLRWITEREQLNGEADT